MKLALLFILPFAFIDCQNFYVYYPPRFFDPLVYYNQVRSFQDNYLWFRNLNKAHRHFEGAQENQEDELLGEQTVANPSERDTPLLRAHGWMQHSNRDSPVEARFLFNQGNAGLLGETSSTFNFALKTLVQTTVATKTVLTTALCIPATLIGFATYCSRRRRDIEAFLAPILEPGSLSLEPSPSQKVETTVLQPEIFTTDEYPTPSNAYQGSPLIVSSKALDETEIDESGLGIARAKRFFITRTTLTSYSFSTSTVKRPVTITAGLNGNAAAGCIPGVLPLNCLLSCIPPGYVVC